MWKRKCIYPLEGWERECLMCTFWVGIHLGWSLTMPLPAEVQVQVQTVMMRAVVASKV
jgi:hypothetical protein